MSRMLESPPLRASRERLFVSDGNAELETRSQIGGVASDYGVDAPVIARDNAFRVESVVNCGLEYLRALPGYLRASDSAYQLLALAAEHPTGYYFYPSTSWTQAIHS